MSGIIILTDKKNIARALGKKIMAPGSDGSLFYSTMEGICKMQLNYFSSDDFTIIPMMPVNEPMIIAVIPIHVKIGSLIPSSTKSILLKTKKQKPVISKKVAQENSFGSFSSISLGFCVNN